MVIGRNSLRNSRNCEKRARKSQYLVLVKPPEHVDGPELEWAKGEPRLSQGWVNGEEMPRIILLHREVERLHHPRVS